MPQACQCLGEHIHSCTFSPPLPERAARTRRLRRLSSKYYCYLVPFVPFPRLDMTIACFVVIVMESLQPLPHAESPSSHHRHVYEVRALRAGPPRSTRGPVRPATFVIS